MDLSVEQILQALRSLLAAERLRVAEQVIHELVREATPVVLGVQTTDAVWANESDADFRSFQRAVEDLRAADVWRSGDEQGPLVLTTRTDNSSCR